MSPVEIPLELLHVGGDHIPGPMDLRRVLALLDGSHVDDRPLEVRPVGGRFEVRNGRHRYAAALLQGQLSYPCTLR